MHASAQGWVHAATGAVAGALRLVERASHASMQELCRQRFVVESIVEVPGP